MGHYTTQWDTRRHRHAVFAQRCAGPPYERNGLRSRSLAVRTWPSLWDEANVARQASHWAPTPALPACTGETTRANRGLPLAGLGRTLLPKARA